jgi:hypothetical protein
MMVYDGINDKTTADRILNDLAHPHVVTHFAMHFADR